MMYKKKFEIDQSDVMKMDAILDFFVDHENICILKTTQHRNMVFSASFWERNILCTELGFYMYSVFKIF